jgi:hypothetical protein
MHRNDAGAGTWKAGLVRQFEHAQTGLVAVVVGKVHRVPP